MARLLAMAMAVLLSGCTLVSERSFAQWANDLSMTAAVKRRLAGAVGMGTLTGVSVHTYNDTVTLRGTVPDEATRQRIDALARNVAGANRVVNQLRLPGEPSHLSRR